MGGRIFRSRVLLIALLVCAGDFSAAGQEPAHTLQGPITSFAPIVEKVTPTVVTIFTTQTISRPGLRFPFSDEALREFFGGQLPRTQGKQTVQGLGSGVIVSPDGYILTANHVVSGAEEIMVGLVAELRKDKAKKMGTDPGTDVALLKIDEKNLPAITFADSDKAHAGDIVLALGNPFGLRQTATMGIISAVGRGGMGIVDYENFIQTDAAINMGNSGGALVDTEGRLVGINTAIFTRTGGNQGVGFAIPSNLARDVRLMIGSMAPGTKVRLETNREGQKKTLDGDLAEMPAAEAGPSTEASPEESAQPEKATVFGSAVVADVTDDVRRVLNLPKDVQGAVIAEIDSDSAAAQAGLREGDVIQEVNKQPIKNPKDLVALTKKLKRNEKILMRVWSQGRSGYIALQPK